MTSILLKKIVRLGRDEDGAALIVTLALFMFMYLSCAGIFAIGQTAKNRIHLQNACDAAAYSAAVVQADTLSRIATINRAMAWTYISMTRRQMDVVTYRWLGETLEHWRDDRDRATDWADSTIHPTPAICSLASLPVGGHLKTDHSFAAFQMPPITLNGAKGSSTSTELEISTQNDLFEYGHVGGDDSFYSVRSPGIHSMVGQIHHDRETIRDMGDKIQSLKDKYKNDAETAAKETLKANLSAMRGNSISEDIFFFLKIEDMNSYVEVLPRRAEERFLSFVGESVQSAFGNSGEIWFVLCGSPDRGFRRGYNWGGDRLMAEWYWYSNQWHCETDPFTGEKHIGPIPCPSCKHDNHDSRCSCTGVGLFHAKVYGDNNRSVEGFRDKYETPEYYTARPNWLVREYFGEEGTITVGLACYNENPWYRIFKSSAGVGKGILGGIFGAFNPYKYMEWSWAFSSAKAGYKFVRGDADYSQDDDDINSRSYVVDWKDGKWNLSQSDLDAVFVPVRRACSMAEGGAWYGDVPPLESWVLSGDWQPLEGSGSSSYAVASMPDLPGMLGNASGIKWNRVAEMLYH